MEEECCGLNHRSASLLHVSQYSGIWHNMHVISDTAVLAPTGMLGEQKIYMPMSALAGPWMTVRSPGIWCEKYPQADISHICSSNGVSSPAYVNLTLQ